MQYIESEITEYTESIWRSTLDLEVAPSGKTFEPRGKENTLAGCVQITGTWEGTVAIVCPVNLAKKVSAIMFGIEENEAGDEEIQDAIGELANMTGGNIKSLLPEPCYLSLPAVAVTDHGFRVPGSELVTQINFECDDSLFMVSLLKRREIQK
jgi:chemotaxis protein CheX